MSYTEKPCPSVIKVALQQRNSHETGKEYTIGDLIDGFFHTLLSPADAANMMDKLVCGLGYLAMSPKECNPAEDCPEIFEADFFFHVKMLRSLFMKIAMDCGDGLQFNDEFEYLMCNCL
jgi:hypothetical protein